jgi:hypothetical protein
MMLRSSDWGLKGYCCIPYRSLERKHISHIHVLCGKTKNKANHQRWLTVKDGEQIIRMQAANDSRRFIFRWGLACEKLKSTILEM